VALVHGFALSEEQAWPILCDYSSRCSPPWSEGELRHKMESAGKLTRHPHPRGHLSGITHRHAVGISIAHVRAVKLAPTFSEMRKTSAPHSPSTSVAPVANCEDEEEAKRIASELAKLHREGAFSGPNDPQAKFYAQVIHTFGISCLIPQATHDSPKTTWPD
jgi:hypothetical protein